MSRARRSCRAWRARIAPPYWQELEREIAPADSILDVGCGASSPIGRFREKVGHVVGVDAHPEAAEERRRAGIHDDVLVADVRELGETFAPASFDVVAAIDLLEHLPEADGARIRLRPRRSWAVVADLSQPLARRAPRLAYHLLCVKDVREA